MPASKRTKPLYVRGGFKLVRRPDRDFLQVVWYDADRKRERSASAGTADVDAGREALDRIYLERTGGEHFCPTCGQRKQSGSVLATTAIADYLVLTADKVSAKAIRARLAHVVAYIVSTGQEALICDAVDEDWIARFRKWLAKRPVISTKGRKRPRTLATIENSVLQFAAVINKSGGISAKFRPQQPKEVNRTPQHRSDAAELAAMFRYCLYPAPGKQPVKRTKWDRAGLLAFLRISVATMARPDAAHDFSTATDREQWNTRRRVISLNPKGRRQTRKYRSVLPAARQIVPLLDATHGYFVPALSVKSAWNAMAASLGLPSGGEAGTKLIRRSVADVLRGRMPQEAWGEIEVWLGHDRFDDTTDLYAPFRPDYLRRALTALETLIDDIETLVPGAFTQRSGQSSS